MFNHISLNQFYKVPLLFVHFVEHSRNDQQMDLVRFIQMHYGGYDENDGDEERDRKLPFKQWDAQFVFQLAINAPKITISQAELPVDSTAPPLYKDISIPDPSLSSLFRPPRAWAPH